jgi:hypothetical protein
MDSYERINFLRLLKDYGRAEFFISVTISRPARSAGILYFSENLTFPIPAPALKYIGI